MMYDYPYLICSFFKSIEYAIIRIYNVYSDPFYQLGLCINYLGNLHVSSPVFYPNEKMEYILSDNISHRNIPTSVKILLCENLSHLPNNIVNCKDLEYLSIYPPTNMINEIPNDIGNLVNLKKLILNTQNLSVIPESIGNLIHLEYLDIKGNNIQIIPESIGNLIHLKHLCINNNNLTSLPESIGKLINLEYLDIKNNDLTSLPESIGNLVNLKHLHIDNNNLKSLPNSLYKLKKLN
jgi:Leucine-rich repeat (LRR) protein